MVSDENTRAWFQAAAKTGISPRELMKEIGILDWLENELSDSFDEIGEVLRGESPAHSIVFSLLPLRDAFLHEAFEDYLINILRQFPPCDEDGLENWMEISRYNRDWFSLPACRPDLARAEELIHEKLVRMTEDMDEEVNVLEGVRVFPFGISRTVTLLSYSLFFIPAIFILLGALIAATSPASFLRWTGFSVLAASLPTLGLSFLTRSIANMAIKFSPYSYSDSWSTGLHELILEKTGWIQYMIVDQLFSPVIAVAVVVCVIGIVLIALSFSARNRSRTVYRPKARISANNSPVPEKTQSEKTEESK